MARVLPEMTPEVAFFWQSGADGILRMLRCGDCGYWIHPPGPICPMCLSRSVAPAELSGRAAVTTFTINRHQWAPDLEVPYTVAIVELPEQEGLRLTTQILECPIDEVEIGMSVQVRFVQDDDVWLPMFEPEVRG